MLTLNLFQLTWRKTLMRSLVVGTLTSLGIISGVSLEFYSTSPQLTWATSVQAQNYTADTVRKVAISILAIEDLRNQAYEEIKELVGSVPAINCHEEDSMSTLTSDARAIAVNYCNSSKKIVEANGLTINQFNEVTMEAQSNEPLRRRIQNAMIQLRRQS